MRTATLFLSAGLIALILTAGPVVSAAPETPLSAATIDFAKLPIEHEALAKMYEDEAASLTRKAAVHAKIAETNRQPRWEATRKHCAALEQAYRIAAQENLELAAIQQELAKEPVE
jgi:hypothetical protein